MRTEEFDLLGNNEPAGNSESATEGLPDDLDYSSVEKVYDSLRKNFDGDLSEKELLNGLKDGLASASGDPYTEFLSTEQAQEFNDSLNGTFSGIGAEIGLENELLIIVSPLKGFPAEQAGLRPGDGILAIDDEETFGFSIEQAVGVIRGEKGTDVKLSVLRDGEQLEFTITRDSIVIPSVEHEILDGNIGYIQITRFAEDTADLTLAAANELTVAGVDSIILDLRNNSGGFLSAAVDVSSLWLDGLLVTQQREDGGNNVTDSLQASSGALLGDVETIVLINEGSASASEIVAGALSDHDKATLLGQKSFGKGSVQSLEEVGDGSLLKVTIARWFTPDGKNIDKEGIKPDVSVKFSEKDFELERDPQRDRALKILKSN